MSGPGGAAPLRLVLASANPDKVKEIVAVLSATLPVELLPRPDDVPEVVEDADTLVGNARLKARALVAATGTAAVADDTGLEVDALGGAPGVFSARYAGEDATYADNVNKLLRELAALDDAGGSAARQFQDGGAGRLSRRVGGVGRGRAARDHRHRRAGDQRLRLRPGLRARRRGRADLRRDAAGGEGRRLPPWPRLSALAAELARRLGMSLAGRRVLVTFLWRARVNSADTCNHRGGCDDTPHDQPRPVAP